jgi:hypothetical protein
MRPGIAPKVFVGSVFLLLISIYFNYVLAEQHRN